VLDLKGRANPAILAFVVHPPVQHYRCACYMANGVQASYVKVDCETGFISMLGHWAVDDCGRLVNPLLVEEQVRGGVVQGIGAVLFEECAYSEDANLLSGTMADYLVPMAGDPQVRVPAR
jgi:carbon-monoxide dehydrogenase large subunit